ncbi:hypothetical protein AB0K48_41000 [Nonomuraea sp. NPDC055795]
MATAHPSVLGRARRPAIFALLVAATGAITGMVLYSQAGLLGLGSRFAVARSPHGFGISLDGDPAFTQGALPGVHVSAGSVEFLTGSPDTAQYIWQALTTLPAFLVTAVAFFLVWRLLWRARQGVYLALGLLAVASVLRDGVRMRDDLEGTV